MTHVVNHSVTLINQSKQTNSQLIHNQSSDNPQAGNNCADNIDNDGNYKAPTSLVATTATKNTPVVQDLACCANKSASDPLHIVLVTETWFPDVNGVAMSLSQIMSELVKLGHKVSLIRPQAKGEDNKPCCASISLTQSKQTHDINQYDTTPNDANQNDRGTNHINQMIAKEICVQGIPIPRYSDMQFGLPQYGFIKHELETMQQQARPVDIVHIATEGPLGLASLMAAKQLNIPVTTGYHTQFHDFSKHFGMGIIAKPLMSYFKWFHNWSDATCVPSQKTQDDLSRLGFERIYQVGRGVDTAHFNPNRRSNERRQSWGADLQHTVLIMVSRLSPEKGVDIVIEAFRALQTAQIHRAAKLVIVGQGPDRTRLEALAAPCGEDVIFTGAKLGVELAEHYASADAFVFASQVETYGNVVIEAMASGLPVYAFDDAAAGMLVTKATGALAPVGQKQTFIEMVAQLPKMKCLHEQGRQAAQAVAQFSWIRPANQMQAMFNVAIAQQHPKDNRVHDEPLGAQKGKKSVLKQLYEKSWLYTLSGH